MTLSGKVGTGHAKQHVDLFRKLQLRRYLIGRAGAHLHGDRHGAYLPFCGDGDLAVELHLPQRFAVVAGVDNDPARIDTFADRMEFFADDVKLGVGLVGDANRWHEALDLIFAEHPIAYADFDAYAYPYDAFRAAWADGPWAERVVLTFTDGERQTVKRVGRFRTPDGAEHDCRRLPLDVRRSFYNAWYSRYIVPWFTKAIAPAVIVATMRYQRQDMVYWGAVIDR